MNPKDLIGFTGFEPVVKYKGFYNDLIKPSKIMYERVVKLIEKANELCDIFVNYKGDDIWQIETTEGIKNIGSTDKLIRYLEYDIKEMAFNLFMEGTLVIKD